MISEFKNSEWTVVTSSKELKKTPIRVFFHDVPVVLFRGENHLCALKDQCPHRGAPLSMGQVCNDSIVCPYHGWKFNGAGEHLEMPGNPCFSKTKQDIVQSYEVAEEAGLIWLRLKSDCVSRRYIPQIHSNYSFYTVTTSIKADIIDISENFLDALHTHFVHSGIIRSRNKRRHNCAVTITNVKDGYQATYIEENQQSGIISQLFGKHIYKSVGRIRFPGIIEIEYYSSKGIELSTVIYVNKEQGDKCKLIVRNYLKKQRIPFFMLVSVLFPFQYLAFKQDKLILEELHKSNKEDLLYKPIITQYDVMRPYIEKALRNEICDVKVQHNLML
ncbi:MAG: Rieske (2Fe-2S) protein [Gammaproteobacteria bacterium]|nr:Rieske (2Fe-2S) protein [Gammaproteobacteria bacterium]